VKEALFWAAVSLAALVVAYLGIGLLVVLQLSAPDRQSAERTPADAGLVYREVGFESTDGVPLRAWWVSEGNPDRAVVLVHGWGGDKSNQQVIETASFYAGEGYGVLMLDLRGNGESGGERRTLGYREVSDVHGALAWLGEQGYEPGEVVLHGWSVGGATVVLAAPGTGVAAVVEEAGYADLPLLLREELPRNSGLPRFFNPGIFLAAKLFLGFNPWDMRPGESAARLREEGVPLFVIHSTDDEVVPYLHADLFVEANPEAVLWKIEGYEHVGAYAHPEYEEKLQTFLDSSDPR
jgi:pimeloyl-ACP methyl ester carboxylesterase